MDDLASFMHALESSGLKARQVKPVPGWEPIFGVRGHLVSIEGDRVTAFEYETAKAAERLQSSVSKDGDEVGDAIIDWCCPRFYAAGKLVVFHLGPGRSTNQILAQVLGPPFVPR
ncbi:MAG: hypothetical protein ABWY83_01325 [Actinomycetota bacterium]